MSVTSQEFESYVPVYDTVPDSWEDAKPFLTEMLKKISTAVNTREIGFYLDEELLTGKAFIPAIAVGGNNPGIFRSILRIVIVSGPLINGVNPPIPHGITVDANFTLIDMWVSATNSSTLNSVTLSDPQNVQLNGNFINITSPGIFDRSNIFLEYIQEI